MVVCYLLLQADSEGPYPHLLRRLLRHTGVSNPGIGQIIPIEPELVIYRDAGVARTQHSLKNPEAKSFIAFLNSSQGHAIFKQFGWNK